MIESIFATGVPFGGKPTLPATLQDLARLMPDLRRACGAGGRRRSTSPMSRPAATTGSGSAG
jgi:hypothetical protein